MIVSFREDIFFRELLDFMNYGHMYVLQLTIDIESYAHHISNPCPVLSNWAVTKTLGYLLYIRDYTKQLYKEFSKPLEGSLLTNQYNGMSQAF